MLDYMKRSHRKQRVYRKWKELSKKHSIYRDTDPVSFKDGRLIVAVTDPAVHSTLNMKMHRVLQDHMHKITSGIVQSLEFIDQYNDSGRHSLSYSGSGCVENIIKEYRKKFITPENFVDILDTLKSTKKVFHASQMMAFIMACAKANKNTFLKSVSLPLSRVLCRAFDMKPSLVNRKSEHVERVIIHNSTENKSNLAKHIAHKIRKTIFCCRGKTIHEGNLYTVIKYGLKLANQRRRRFSLTSATSHVEESLEVIEQVLDMCVPSDITSDLGRIIKAFIIKYFQKQELQPTKIATLRHYYH